MARKAKAKKAVIYRGIGNVKIYGKTAKAVVNKSRRLSHNTPGVTFEPKGRVRKILY